MNLRRHSMALGVVLAVIIAAPAAWGGASDESPPAQGRAEAGRLASTQPSASAAQAAYHETVRRARVTYCEALVRADEKLLTDIDADRKAAKRAGNEAEVERLDRRSEFVAARLRADQSRLEAAARAHEPPRVVSASFGRADKWVDVTERVKILAQSPQVVRANAETLGVDPDPGWRKRLEVVYMEDGEERTIMIDAGSDIRVPGLIPAVSESR